MTTWRRLVREAGCDPEADCVDAMLLTAAFLRIAARSKDETRVDYRDAEKSEALDRVARAVTGLLARRLGPVTSELMPGAVACELCDELDAHTIAIRHGAIAFVTAACLDAKLGTDYDAPQVPPEPPIRYHEHLARQAGTAGFDMLISPHCAVVVLICKDAFGEVGDLVQKLAPTLVLIPAMSDETADFELLAKRLAHDPQGLTLVACTGARTHAIFGRPSKESSVITATSFQEGCEIFDLSGILDEK